MQLRVNTDTRIQICQFEAVQKAPDARRAKGHERRRTKTSTLKRGDQAQRSRWPFSTAERFPVAIAEVSHPIPSRTRPLSPPAPMVLYGRRMEEYDAAGFKFRSHEREAAQA